MTRLARVFSWVLLIAGWLAALQLVGGLVAASSRPGAMLWNVLGALPLAVTLSLGATLVWVLFRPNTNTAASVAVNSED